MIANIIDKPRPEGHTDLLGVDKFIMALVEFIKNCQMPTTIGIQGEWGSGKTSMLNQIRYQLCESENLSFEENKKKPFYGIWINTWQYSLMKTREETLISILTGITDEIIRIIKSKHENRTKEVINQVSGIFGKIIKTTAKAAVNATGLDGDEMVKAFDTGENKATLLTFKKSLTDAINKCLEEDRKQGNNNRGFLFFIDDLDRIDPPVAVEILELLKNIFEVDNCIFILAIDYEVVVKGLIPKFGPITEKNEREFRSFFDKIIQLPFTMPVNSYDISNFLIESLKNIDYINAQDINDEEKVDYIVEFAKVTVGNNPRSLKRLINTLSLINIINKVTDADASYKDFFDKILNFGLVCIQIAYPKLYEFLSQEPNFTSWNLEIAKKYNLPEINEVDNAQLSTSELFTEEWELILFRFCSKDIFLKNKVFDISELLNKIEAIIVGSSKDIETEVSRVLNMSAVTSVTVNINQPKQKRTDRSGRDISKYIYNGKEYGKGRCVLAVIKDYVDSHPNITYEELEKVFPQSLQGRETFTTEEIAKAKSSVRVRNFIRPEDIIVLKDARIAVSSGWGLDNFTRFIEHCKKLGIEIK